MKSPILVEKTHVCSITSGIHYVVSEDVVGLLSVWAKKRGYILPPKSFFAELRKEMKKKLEEFFHSVQFVSEEVLKNELFRILDEKVPIISLDCAYGVNSCFQIEATRIVDEQLNDIGVGSRKATHVDDQIKGLEQLRGKKVQLVDDVIFSGRSNETLIGKLQCFGIEVSMMLAGISVGEGVEFIRERFPRVKVSSVIHYERVKDEVCERDFYAGVPFSGRLVGRYDDGNPPSPLVPEQGAPYFFPFGDAERWASIPGEKNEEWGNFCIRQSIRLWEAIEEANKIRLRCSDVGRLPRLISHNGERFVDVLRRFLHDV